MHAKQTKRNNRNPSKRAILPSAQRVYKFHFEPTRGATEERPRLPNFKPIKLSEVLRTKTGKSALNISSDVTIELILRVDAQQEKLLRALGLDGDNPDWAEAFIELAKIHHGVGIIHVGKRRGPNKHAVKWSPKQDHVLLDSVNARLEHGMTVTAALKEIASDKAIWERLPLVKNSRSENAPAFRRVQNFRKRFGSIKKRIDLENIHNQIFESLANGQTRQAGQKAKNRP